MLSPAVAQEVQSVRAVLERVRPGSILHITSVPPTTSDTYTVLDGVCRGCGLDAISTAWRCIPPNAAYDQIVHMLHQDLAYRTPKMSLSEAQALAASFLALFGEAAFYTNQSQSSGWAPLTTRTFDLGVAVVGTNLCGVLCVCDED